MVFTYKVYVLELELYTLLVQNAFDAAGACRQMPSVEL